MEIAGLVAIIIFVVVFIAGARSAPKDPRDSATGRWGMKTGKFISGNWGGEDWGEKPRKRN